MLLLITVNIKTSAQEICFNAIDDDLDGLIDLNDTLDCNCNLLSSGTGVSSIIPNPSFEDNTCCPSSWSQLNCADTWVQATSPTTDYMHSCDFYPFPGLAPPPNGDGIVGAFILGGWMEFVGGCLLSPMEAGTQYTLNFDIAAVGTDGTFSMTCPFNIPIDVTLYGFSTCPTFPVGTSGCPVPNGWVELGTVNYTPLDQWQQVTIDFTPSNDIEAVMIGGPCTLPVGYPTSSGSCTPYFMYDDLTMNESIFFNSNVEVDGHFCTDDLMLTAHPDTLGDYQWFLDGVAIIGETDTIIDISGGTYGPGDYSFMLSLGVDSCSISIVNVQPVDNPVANFSATPVTGCSPLNVNFTNLTDPGLIGDCSWDFGDGTTSTDCDPSHTYFDVGTYSVSLTVTSPDGCVHDTTFVDYVLVSDFAEPLIALSTNNGCTDLTIDFSNLADPNLVATCAWTFGDGSTSNDCNPTHTYTTPGVYDVSLTITSPGGCISDSTYVQAVTVHQMPTALFTVDDPDGCISHNVQFTNNTDPLEIGNSEWIFGDGTGSNVQNPAHVYSNPGIYDVTLIITSPEGCMDTAFAPALIEAYDFEEALFTLNNGSGCTDLSVDFNNLADPNLLAACAWTFGDGSTSNDCNPTYTYTTPGVYDVSLTLTSPGGCITDSTQVQAVSVYQTPTALFSVDDPDGCIPHNAQFTNNTNPLEIGSSEWLFGDGTGSNALDPAHTYVDPGTYDLTLIITSPEGCMDTAFAPALIVAYGYPEVQFTVDDSSGCWHHGVHFSNLTDPNMVGSCIWNFGDGTSSTNCDPDHVYYTAGLYNVSLNITSPDGCTDSNWYPNMIEVFEHPIAGFQIDYDPSDACNITRLFLDNSSTDVVQWQWDFGGAGSSTDEDPIFQFLNPIANSYLVTQTVYNENGCESSTNQVVSIDGSNLYVPNAFTPNGDGHNEVFIPMGNCLDDSEYELMIFDRWGELVFSSNNPYEPWTGVYKGQLAKSDVYVWKLTAKPVHSLDKYNLTGSVTLLR